MTLPVFSAREVEIVRSTKSVCRQCRGDKRIVVKRPSTNYKCGYITVCITCPGCLGYGLVEPVPVSDFKTEACHD